MFDFRGGMTKLSDEYHYMSGCACPMYKVLPLPSRLLPSKIETWTIILQLRKISWNR